MASQYSVIQYHPNAIIGECVNIGCVAFDIDGTVVHNRFLKNWDRVKAFSGDNCDFLLSYAEQFNKIIATKELVNRFIGSDYPTVIQYTPLRGSLRTAEELIEEIASRFLVERV